MTSFGEALTWDELAELYPGKAKIRPMERVFDYFAKQKDKYYVHPEEGTIHLILDEKEKQMNDEVKVIEGEVLEETGNAQIVPHESSVLAPAGTINELLDRYNLQREFIEKVLKEGIDYGKIPGSSKDTLLKAGAEKITTLFGLSIRFPIELRKSIEDWTGENHNGEPFFFYEDTCQLWKGDVLIAEATGSCNSWEKKYRYRQAELKCPTCGKGSIIKGKAEYGGGWVCWAKKGGCGAKFPDNDPVINGQNTDPIKNEFIFDQVNTIKKMCQKRALVAATLMAGNVSDYFTQDVEDSDEVGGSTSTAPEKEVNPAELVVSFPKAKKLFDGRSPTVAELFAKSPDYCNWIMENKPSSPAAKALRVLVGQSDATERKAQEMGTPTSHATTQDNQASIKAVGVLLEQTDGILTPTHYWPNVKAMGMGQERAQELSEGLGKDDDWRRVLEFAYEEMKNADTQ